MKDYFVYIMSGNSMVFYVGVTNDIKRRVSEHKDERDPKTFVGRYNLYRLVFYETFPTAREAIAFEKKLKGWSREKKKKLITPMNPMWRDLSEDFFKG
jgi:putative endonuclease